MRKPKIKSQKAWSCLYGRRDCGKPTRIVIHFTSDKGATAQNELDYFSKNPSSKPILASAHFFVDPNMIGQSVPPKYRANHCGLGGGTFESGHHPQYGITKNDNSIGIEMCITKHGNIDRKTVIRTRQLVMWLMSKYHIPKSKIFRHYDVTGKACPGCHYEKSNGELSDNSLLNDGTWGHFKDLITE